MTERKLRRLIARANLRRRAQRFVDWLVGALLPALTLAACAILLAKSGWLHPGELWLVLGGLGALSLVVALVAAAWPISALHTLIRLDTGNDFRDRLSSAWAFLQLPADARTPQMELHLARTLERLDEVGAAPAEPFHWPPALLPVVGVGALAGLIGLLVEPEYPPLPPTELSEPVHEVIVDTGALLADIRHIEALEALAEESEDPELEAIHEELAGIGERLQRGQIGREELLERLDDVEQRLADLTVEEPPDMQERWREVAEEIREALADEEVAEQLPEAVAEQLEAVADALEEGDESAVAEAIEQVQEMLESEALDPEDREELAQWLERFSDMFDPSDEELQELIERYRDQIAEYEQSLSERDSRRTRRRLDSAREDLAEAEARLQAQRDQFGRAENVSESISEALQQAADALREEPPTQEAGGESEEQAEGEEREGEQGEEREGEPGEGEERAGEDEDLPEASEELAEEGTERQPQESESPEAPEGEPAEGDTEAAEEQADSESPEEPPEGQEAGERRDGEEQARSGEQQTGQPSEDPSSGQEAGDQSQAEDGREASAEPESSEPGDDSAQRPDTPEDRAAEALDRAAEELRDIDRSEAAEEGRERAEQATEGIRENMQRFSGEPQDESQQENAENWQDFMDRADGMGESRPGEGDDQGEAAEHEGTPQESSEDSYGDEEGGEALGEASEETSGERVRERAETVESEEGEADTGDTIRSAAVEGFASRGYREVYQEYAQAAEEALESEEIPAGYARFIERYFELIEPR